MPRRIPGWQCPLVLAFLLALLPGATGCTTVSVAWMQPRADGSVEFTLYDRSKSPNLHIKGGGELTLDSQLTVSQRVRWRASEPPQLLPADSREGTAALPGVVPQREVPVLMCSPPGAGGSPPALAARQLEGEPVVWCTFSGSPGHDGHDGRIEGRTPGAAAPLVSLRLGDPAAASWRVLPGRRALLKQGPRTWLLDAGSGAAIPLADQEGNELHLLGATPEGDVLFVQVYERTETRGAVGSAVTLRLRSGQTLQLPRTTSQLVSAAGALWLYDSTDRRLLQVDPESGRITPAAVSPTSVAGAAPAAGSQPGASPSPRLLGSDLTGFLWFESDSPEVKPGRPLHVWRWNPRSRSHQIVALPTH